MARQINKTDLAENDLLDIWLFIAESSEEQANLLINRVYEKAKMLLTHPEIGRPRSEQRAGLFTRRVGAGRGVDRRGLGRVPRHAGVAARDDRARHGAALRGWSRGRSGRRRSLSAARASLPLVGHDNDSYGARVDPSRGVDPATPGRPRVSRIPTPAGPGPVRRRLGGAGGPGTRARRVRPRRPRRLQG